MVPGNSTLNSLTMIKEYQKAKTPVNRYFLLLGLTPTRSRYGVTICGSGVDGQGAWINSGGATSATRIQTPFLSLTGDATIGGIGDFFMIYASFGPSSITLNGHTLTKTGANTFTVADTTIATGKVHIAQGVFAQHSTLNAASVDASFARFSLADTSGVTLLLNNKDFIAGSLEGGGATGGLVSLGSGVLTLGNLATNAVYRGTISGGGGITKVGQGMQSFNGVYSYSGATVISNGTLAVNGTHQGGGSYLVADGAILAGTGTVSLATGATVTVEAGGTIAPGAQPLEGGTLQLGALNLEQGSSILIDNPSDLIHVTGNLDTADASVVITDMTLYDKQLSYPLISCDGVITGEFDKNTGDPLWIVTRRGNSFALVYSSGTFMMVR
jgi:autotransporter-associated beta strand protein